MAKEVGAIYYKLDLKTGQFDREMATASAKAKTFGQTTGASFNKLATVGKVALGVGVAGAVAMVASNIGNAVKRVDTLRNAPKVLQNLGFSAEEAQSSFSKLEQGTRGLPTSLDAITTSLTAITSASGKSLAYSTDLTLAFNNMALAGGKGPQEAQRAMVQFTQALGRGKMGMQEFNTLAEVMPAQLGQVAKSLMGSEANIATLREALSDGTVTMDQFSDAIIDLNANGGDGFASFAVQAKDATGGIGTAWANMQTAITRGITKVIDSLGSEKITKAIEKIGKAFEKGLEKVADAIEWVSDKEYILAGLAGVIGGVLVASIYSLIASAWALMASPLGIIVGIFALLGATVLYVKNHWDKFVPIIDKAKQAWTNLKTAVQPVMEYFRANILPVLKQIGEFIKNQLLIAWNDLVQSFNRMKTVLEPYFPLLQKLAIIIGIVVVAPILILVAAIATLLAIFIAVGVIIARAIGWFAQIYTSIYVFTAGVISWFGEMWTKVVDVWNKLMQKGREAKATHDSIMQGIVNVILSIIRWFASLWQNVVNAWNIIVAKGRAVMAWFSGAGSWLYGAGMAVVTGLANGIRNAGGAVWNAISSVSANIGNFFAGAWNWLYGVGQTIIQGLINGISSKINEVKNTLGSLTDMLPEWKGPPEKDRKILVKSGQLIMQGLNDGIGLEVGNIEKNLNNITTRIGNTRPSVDMTNGGVQRVGGNTAVYGNINIGNRQDADYFLTRLNNDMDLASMGLAG